jgi:hypothetical protein
MNCRSLPTGVLHVAMDRVLGGCNAYSTSQIPDPVKGIPSEHLSRTRCVGYRRHGPANMTDYGRAIKYYQFLLQRESVKLGALTVQESHQSGQKFI